MKNVWKYLMVLSLCLGLGACSSDKSEAMEVAKQPIAGIAELAKQGMMDSATAEEAQQAIVAFEVAHPSVKYWVLVGVVLLFWIVAGAFADWHMNGSTEKLERPIGATRGYGYWLIGGAWGAHFMTLRYYRPLAYLALGLTAVFCIFYHRTLLYLFVGHGLWCPTTWECMNLSELGVFYTCAIGLMAIYAFNLLVGFLTIPYQTYRFNATYFRRHKDTDAILRDADLPIDEFYREVADDMRELNNDMDTIIDILNGDCRVLDYNEDEENQRGFFKSLFTFGASRDLAENSRRLREVKEVAEVLQGEINALKNTHERLYEYLQFYRIAAYRNLYLAKELVSYVRKTVKGKGQELVFDQRLTNPMAMHHTATDEVDLSIATFNSTDFCTTFEHTLGNAFNGLNATLEERGLTKNDFVETGMTVATEMALSAIENVIEMNMNVREQSRIAAAEINRIIEQLGENIPRVQEFQAEMLRYSELMIALSACNKAFINAYEPLRQMIFGEPSFAQYLFGVKRRYDLSKDPEFIKQLHHLSQVCSTYNNVYSVKH